MTGLCECATALVLSYFTISQVLSILKYCFQLLKIFVNLFQTKQKTVPEVYLFNSLYLLIDSKQLSLHDLSFIMENGVSGRTNIV